MESGAAPVAMPAGSTALSYSLKGTKEGKQAVLIALFTFPPLRTPSQTEKDRGPCGRVWGVAGFLLRAGWAWEKPTAAGGRSQAGLHQQAGGPEVLAFQSVPRLWACGAPAPLLWVLLVKNTTAAFAALQLFKNNNFILLSLIQL